MPKVGSEQYEILEEPVVTTSANTADIKTVAPTNKRAIGVWLTVESNAARVTFGGANPGAATAPGLLIPISTPPLFYPFAFTPINAPGPKIKFASNTASPSTLSVVWVV